ncbi:MAG: CGNR zinc finger domain-containing protein [Proteobacteria bacterium]|nr:CGNR zinc finger domain-containing protein [Pseudomonadota bacterium]
MNTAAPALFLADSSGLDFLNSIATPIDTPVDWIVDGTGLIAWLRQSQLVPADSLDRVASEATPQALDAVAAQARELREWLRRFVLKYNGHPLTVRNTQELEPVNALLRQDQSFSQLVIGKEGIQLDAQRRWTSAQMLLVPIAEAIARMISEEDFTHIKTCEGHACTLIFADHTRAHGRRWCSMSLCGNRAKVSAHRRRQRAVR